MPRPAKSVDDVSLLSAALEGLELQRQRIEEQISRVKALLGQSRGTAAATTARRGRRRELSPAARRRIALAQKRRWAEYRKKAAAAKQS